MRTRIALAAALAAVLGASGATLAADDLRTIWDNKSGTITQAIDNENWGKASDKSLEWLQQLGGYDGSYPEDVNAADCTRAYDDLLTGSGAAAYGGKSMGDSKGNPGLVGNIMYNVGAIEGPKYRSAVDECIAGAPAPEGSADPEAVASPESES